MIVHYCNAATLTLTPSRTPTRTPTPIGCGSISGAESAFGTRNDTQSSRCIITTPATTTPTPTISPTPIGNYYINCTLQGVNVRNYPAGQTAPTACAAITPNFTQSTATPPAPSFPIGQPGCAGNNSCPHTNPNISDVDLVSFILACEAGAGTIIIPPNEAIEDAIGNAHVVYNRMDSGLYIGTARQVVSHANQWTPYTVGCNSTLGLGNLSAIDPRIRGAAQQLVNQPPTEPSFAVSNGVDWLGLYTFGVPNPNHTATPPSVEVMLTPYCPQGITQAMRVYVAIASFGDGARPNASVFFSDSPGCVFN